MFFYTWAVHCFWISRRLVFPEYERWWFLLLSNILAACSKHEALQATLKFGVQGGGSFKRVAIFLPGSDYDFALFTFFVMISYCWFFVLWVLLLLPSLLLLLLLSLLLPLLLT